MSHNDMKLPAGKTCGDCAYYKRCVALFECPADNTECDWAPSRFRQRVVHLCAHGFPHPCSQCSVDNELANMLRLRKELDPDAPDMIVFPDPAPNRPAREAAYEIIGLMNPDVDRVEQVVIKHFGTEVR